MLWPSQVSGKQRTKIKDWDVCRPQRTHLLPLTQFLQPHRTSESFHCLTGHRYPSVDGYTDNSGTSCSIIIESTNQSHDCFLSQRDLSLSHSSGSSSIILFTSEKIQDNHIFMQNVSNPSSAEPLVTNECGYWHLGHWKKPKSSVPLFKMALERWKQMFPIYVKM